MKPSTGQLISLKAILLGHAASLDPLRKRDADTLVSSAISRLEQTRERHRLLQLAFHRLVRAELRRIGGDPVPDRLAAQRIAKELRSDLFKSFMEQESQTEWLLYRKRPTLDDPTPPEPSLSPWSATVSYWTLTPQQEYFLYRANLVDILGAQGIAPTDA